MRPLRIEFPGAVYHVTARGNERRDIYGDGDHPVFLATLEQTVARFAWLCHAYCLMSNHYHLVLETPKPNLARGMRHLNGVYAQRFNRRHGRVGHLFQARYDAKLIDDDAHLLACARYVVCNPVRAGLCAHPSDWPWSSYGAAAGLVALPRFLYIETILALLAGRGRDRHAAYRAFIEAADVEPPPLLGDLYLGSAAFAKQHAPATRLDERPLKHAFPVRRTLSEILAEGREGILRAYRDHGYTLHEIGKELGVHYSTVSRALAELERVQGLTPRKT